MFRPTLKYFLIKFFRFRHKYISNKNLLFIASIFIGIVAGLVAVLLKIFTHSIEEYLLTAFDKDILNILYFFFPLTGIIISAIIIKKLLKGDFRKGLGHIISSIPKNGGKIDVKETWSHVLTSGITVGFGGSVGMEAPIAATGAAIGSNIARFLRLNSRERVLLLASGTAAGIAGVFNVPIAGVIFVLEVILGEFAIPAFIPLLLSSATATLVSQLFYKGQLFILLNKPFEFFELPAMALVGVFTGVYSVYLMRITLKFEEYYSKKKKTYLKAILGGLLIGLLIFILPPLYGEGYKSIQNLLNGNAEYIFNQSLFYSLKSETWAVIVLLILLLVIKPIAAVTTVGAGGNGGILAPSLFTGAFCGYLVYYLLSLAGMENLSAQHLVLLGMAGVLAGVVHAPLSGIFLIAEISGGYALFVPLMLVVSLSYFIARYFEPYSIYHKPLAEKANFVNYDKDKSVLIQIKVNQLLECDFIPVYENTSLREMIEIIAKSKRNIFPVIDSENNFKGIIFLDDLKSIMFKEELYDSLKMIDIAQVAPSKVGPEEPMNSVMEKFDRHNVWNLPVIKHGKYLGFISKSSIFNKYRELLIKQASTLHKI